MGNSYRSKHKNFFNNISRRNRVSGQKYKKLIDSYILLLKKEEAQGMNKRIANAKKKAHDRFEKYGISSTTVESALESKGSVELGRFISFRKN